MQVNFPIQPTNFTSPISPIAEKIENVKTEVQEVAPKEAKEASDQPEKLYELLTALAEHNITLNFSRDAETNELVVKLVDDRTGEEVQQFPTEVSLKLAATFAKLQGQFVDEVY